MEKTRCRRKPDLTQAGNFFYKLEGKVPQDWQIRMLDTIFILYADHEFNASTFAARVTASTLAGMYAAVTSGSRKRSKGHCTAAPMRSP